jgi:hypothetical protein
MVPPQDISRCIRAKLRSIDTRPQISDSNIPTRNTVWSQVPQWCSIPRHIDWLTVSRKVTSTSTLQQDDLDQFRPSAAGKVFKARVSLPVIQSTHFFFSDTRALKCVDCITGTTGTNKIVHRLNQELFEWWLFHHLQSSTNNPHRLHSFNGSQRASEPYPETDEFSSCLERKAISVVCFGISFPCTPGCWKEPFRSGFPITNQVNIYHILIACYMPRSLVIFDVVMLIAFAEDYEQWVLSCSAPRSPVTSPLSTSASSRQQFE